MRDIKDMCQFFLGSLEIVNKNVLTHFYAVNHGFVVGLLPFVDPCAPVLAPMQRFSPSFHLIPSTKRK